MKWRANPCTLYLLLGLGLTIVQHERSRHPGGEKNHSVHHHGTCQGRWLGRVMSFDSERQVMHYLRDETRKIDPGGILNVNRHEGTSG